MKKTFFTLQLIAFLFCSAVVYGQYDTKAKSILDAMNKKYKDFPAFKANFSCTLSSPEGMEDTFAGEITVKDNKYRLMLGQQEVINNLENVWTLFKEEKEVTITKFEKDPEDLLPSDIFDIYKEGFKYVYVEDSKIEGKVYEIVELSPEDTDLKFYKIRLEINKTDKSLRSYDMYEKGGRIYKYKITDFTPKSSIADSYFVYNEKEHPEIEVIDLR